MTAYALEPGNWAVITGAGRGIGRFLAQHFAAKGMRIVLDTPDPIEALRKVFEGHAKPGRGRIEIRALNTEEGDVDFTLDKPYQVNAAFRQAIKSIAGIVDVQDL